MNIEIVDSEPAATTDTDGTVTKPPKLERCVQHLMEQGHSEESAYAICSDALHSMMDDNGEKPKAAPGITALEPLAGLRRKCFVAETRALKNGDVEHYISAESPDRLGDMIRAKGWEFTNYRKTGSPVLFGHENGITPGGHIAHIGNAVDMAVQGKKVWSVTRFHEKTQLSREAAILAREKIVTTWSVGFNPLEPPEQRMEDGVFKGFIFNRQELLEYSLVLIPAHPDAVSKAMFYVEKGLIRREVAAVIAGPAPLAGTDSGNEDGRLVMPGATRQSDEHLARMAGLYFLKRLL